MQAESGEESEVDGAEEAETGIKISQVCTGVCEGDENKGKEENEAALKED